MAADENPDPIDALLASISDGQTLDWDAAQRDAGPENHRHVEALRDVARIADFNRSLQRRAPDGDPTLRRERWGPLLLLERVGASSRSEVYRAWDPALQREVALKLIRADAHLPLIDVLLAEGRAAARVRHPNVVMVHGIDAHDGEVGLWMDLVRGGTLQQQITNHGPLDPDAAMRLAGDLGAALAAVHDAGLVHRDVKPANVMRDHDGRYILTDFGLGRIQPSAAEKLGPSGTPMYMAPELFGGATATVASDIYSMGLVVWFALAGRKPFEAATLRELAHEVKRGAVPRLDTLRRDLPPGLVQLVQQTLALAPEQRIGSAHKFLAALESIRNRAPRPHRTTRLLSLLALLLVASIAVFVSRNRPREAPPVVADASRVETSSPAVDLYSVEATFMRRSEGETRRLRDGDRIRPGDRLSLEFRATRAAFVYVLNEDERGQHFLLFPQPRFDLGNPVPRDSSLLLPGTIGGRENAWTVTSVGGREHFVIVVSPEAVPEIEAELSRMPAAAPGRPIEYARVGGETIERLRGVGGVTALPPSASRLAERSQTIERFRALAGREDNIRGVLVREVVFENP